MLYSTTFTTFSLFLLSLILLLRIEPRYPQPVTTVASELVHVGWQRSSVTIYGNARVSLPLTIQRLPRPSVVPDTDTVTVTVTDTSIVTSFINGTSPVKTVWRTSATVMIGSPPNSFDNVYVNAYPELEDNPFNFMIDSTVQVIPLQFSLNLDVTSSSTPNVTIVNQTITVHVCRQVITNTSDPNYDICGPSNVPPYIVVDPNVWVNYVDKLSTNSGRSMNIMFPFKRITYPGNPAPMFSFQFTNYETDIAYVGGYGTVNENMNHGMAVISNAYFYSSNVAAGNYSSLLLFFSTFTTLFQYDIGFPSRISNPAPRVRLYGAGTKLGDLPFPDWMNVSVLFSASPPDPVYDYVKFAPVQDGLSLYPLQPWILVDNPPVGTTLEMLVRGVSIQRAPAIDGWRKGTDSMEGPVTATVTVTMDQPAALAPGKTLCSLGNSNSLTVAWPASPVVYDDIVSVPLVYDTDPFRSGTIRYPYNETLDYVSCTIALDSTKGLVNRYEIGTNIMTNGIHYWWNNYTVLFCRNSTVCAELTNSEQAMIKAMNAGYDISNTSPIHRSSFGFISPDGGMGGSIVVPGDSQGLWRSLTGDIAVPVVRRTNDPSIDFVGPAKIFIDVSVGDSQFLTGTDYGVTTAKNLLQTRRFTILYPPGDYRDSVYYKANPAIVALPTNSPSSAPSASAAPLSGYNSSSASLSSPSLGEIFPPPQGYMDGFTYKPNLDPRVRWLNVTFPMGDPFQSLYPANNFSTTVPYLRLSHTTNEALGINYGTSYRFFSYNLYVCRDSSSCPWTGSTSRGITPAQANAEHVLPFLGFTDSNVVVTVYNGGWGDPGLSYQLNLRRSNEDWTRNFNFYVNLVDPSSTRVYGIDLLPSKTLTGYCSPSMDGSCGAIVNLLMKDPFASLPSNIIEFNLTYTIDKASLRGWAQMDGSRSTLIVTFRKYIDVSMVSPSPAWESPSSTPDGETSGMVSTNPNPSIINGIDMSTLQNPTTANVIRKLRFVVAVVATSRYAIQRYNAFPINSGNALEIAKTLFTNNTWTDLQYATNQAIWGLASSDLDISRYTDPATDGLGIDLLTLATDHKNSGTVGNNFHNNNNPEYQGLMTQRLATNDDVSLFADLWVTSTDSILNAVQHGIPVGSSSYFVPNGVSDSRPGMRGRLPNNTLINALPTYNFKGIDLAITSTRWMIRGVPMEPLVKRFSQAGRTPLHSLQDPHLVTLFSNSSSILVPAGTLIPGYAYAADADITFTASLATDYSSIVNGFAPTSATAVTSSPIPSPSNTTVSTNTTTIPPGPRLRQLQEGSVSSFLTDTMIILRIQDQKGITMTGKVYLDEIFLSNYTVRQTIGLPFAAGSTLGFTLPSVSPTDPHGQLELTKDGRYLLMVGYNATVNATLINSTKVARTILRIRSDGSAEYLSYNTPVAAEARAVASLNGDDMYVATGLTGGYYINTSITFNRTAVKVFQPFQSIDSVSVFDNKVIFARKGYAYSMFLNDTFPTKLQLNDDPIGAINIEARGVIFNNDGTEMWTATIGEGLVYMYQINVGGFVSWNRQSFKPSVFIDDFLDVAWSPDKLTIFVTSDSGIYGFDYTNRSWLNNGNSLYTVGNGQHLRGISFSPRLHAGFVGNMVPNNGSNATDFGNPVNFAGNYTDYGNYTQFDKNFTFFGNYSNYTNDNMDNIGEFVVLRVGNGLSYDSSSLAVPLFFDAYKLKKGNNSAYVTSSGTIDLPIFSNSATEPAVTLPKFPEDVGQVRLSRDRTKAYFVGLDYSVPYSAATLTQNTGQAVVAIVDLLLEQPQLKVVKLKYSGGNSGSSFGNGAPYPTSILCLRRDKDCYISWSNITGANTGQAGGIIYVPSLEGKGGCRNYTNSTGSGLEVTEIWNQSAVQSFAYLENNPSIDTNPVADTGLYFQRKDYTTLFNFYPTDYPTVYVDTVNPAILSYQGGCNAFVFMNRNESYMARPGAGLVRVTAPFSVGSAWSSTYYKAGMNSDVTDFIDLALSGSKELLYAITTSDVYVFSTSKLEFLNGGRSVQTATNGTSFRSVAALLSYTEKMEAIMKMGTLNSTVSSGCGNVSALPNPSPSPLLPINTTNTTLLPLPDNSTINATLSSNVTLNTTAEINATLNTVLADNSTVNTTLAVNTTINVTVPLTSFSPLVNPSLTPSPTPILNVSLTPSPTPILNVSLTPSPTPILNVSSSPILSLNDTNITVSSSPMLPSATPSPTSASQSASWSPVVLSPSSSITPAISPSASITPLRLSPSSSITPIVVLSPSSTPMYKIPVGFSPTKYVREFATVSASSVHSALMYVHMNPYDGRMLLSSTNGTALLTRFNITTTGWVTDASLATHTVNDPPPSLFNMLAWSVGNGYYSDSMFAQISSLANNLTFYNHYLPTIAALNMSTCRVASSSFVVAQSSVPSETRLTTPAWVLQAGILGGRLGLPIDQTCNNWNLGVHHLLNHYATTNVTVPSPRTAIPPPLVSFRVDVNGILRSPNRTSIFVNPVQAQRNLLQIANSAAWYGTPLAAATTTNYTLVTTLPTGTGAQNSLALYTFYADGEGGLNWLESVAYSSPALVGDAAKDPVAVTNYVTEVTKTITTASVQENPYGSLLAVKSLGGLLSNASSSTLASNTTNNAGQNVTSEVRANNTALRTSLVSAVLTAVTTITTTSPTVSNLPPSTTNVSAEARAALRADTSIAVDDGTVATAATALTSLTSDPTELSTSARKDALQAVATLLTFSLPTNVLYGAVDDDDTLPANISTNTPPNIVPAFPVSAATDMLGVMVNVISVDDVSSQVVGIEGTGEVVDAKAVAAGNISTTRPTDGSTAASNSTGDVIREKVNSVLRSLSAAVLRSAEPGDRPVSIASGPSKAFATAVTNARRLSDNATLEGYCGPGLSITTARLSTQTENETAINLENPMVPCYAAGSVTPTMTVSNVEPPQIKVTQGFFASATSSRVVDIAMVQNGRSPVPETVGFRSMRFSTVFSGSSANLAETPSTNTTTVASTNGGRRLSTTSTSGGSSGSIQSAIAAAGLSLSSGNETKDLDPTSGLDSRVISVNLQSRAGRKVEVYDTKEPIIITIPLKDPVKGSSALQLQSTYRRIGYNITCPLNSVGTAASNPVVTVGTKLPVSVYYLNGNGTRDSGSTVNLTTADVVGVSTLTYLAKDTSKTSYFGYTVGSAVKLTSSSVYVLSVDCGGPVGTRNITCGPEFYGQSVTYECPDIGLLPLCAYWDESLRRWSTAGCSIAEVTDTSVVCACNHLTEFAARFAALADEQRDIFARSADIFENPADLLEKYPHVFIIIGIIFALTVVSFLFSWALDKRAAVKFYETLLEDEEVQFLARIEELKGNVFILDRILDSRKAAISDEIKAARLELEAKRIAEEHGLVYMRRTLHESELLKSHSLFSTLLQRNKKVVHKVTQKSSTGGPLLLSDGSTSSSTANSSAASNDSLTIHIANPMLNNRRVPLTKDHLTEGSDTETGTPNNGSTPSTPVSDIDLIASSSLIKKRKYLDPYTAALYLRVTEAFDSFKVRASSVKEEYRAGVISKDTAKQFGVEEEDLNASESETATPATPTMMARGRALVHTANKNLHDILRSPRPLSVQRRGSHTDNELDAVATKAAELEYAHVNAAESTGLRGSIVHKAREKIQKLEESGTWSIVRAWRLRNFIFRMWFLKVWFNHLYLSIFTKYDPRLSRTARTLLLASALLSSLFCTAFFFAFRNGGPNQNLPPLELIEVVVVSILSALMQQPITMGINILISRAGTAEFTYRYPFIAAEIQRRKDAETRLAKLSKKQLEAELRSAARERSTERGTLRGALTNNAPHALGSSGGGGINTVSSSSTALVPDASHGSAPPDHPTTVPFEISTVIDMSDKERTEDFAYGWVDPPSSCVDRCGCLLRICHRHPSQKAAYIKYMADQETKARAAREKKLQVEKLKKKQRKLAKQQKKGNITTNGGTKADNRTENNALSSTVVAVPNVMTTVSANMMEAKFEEKGLPKTFTNDTKSSVVTPHVVDNAFISPPPPPAVVNDTDDSDDDDDADTDGDMFGDKTASSSVATNAAMDETADNSNQIDGAHTGDCSVSCVACLCGFCGARSTVRTEAKKRRRSLRNLTAEGGSGSGGGTSDADSSSNNRRRSVNWSTLFSGTSAPHEMKEAMEHSAKIVERDEMHRAAMRRQNRLLYFCRLAPFTMLTVIAYSVAWAVILFFLYYLFLFGLVQSKEVTLTFTYAFLSSQAMSAIIVQPGVMFATTLFTFAILPAWLPYVIWIPIVGPLLAGKTAAALSSNDGSATLTGRMENLTLVRAAGAASALTPDAAMVAYGVTAVMGAALSGVNQAARQVLHGRNAALNGGNEPQNAFAAMTAAQRHELIVRRYLVAQLRAAEAARKEQLALARARALAFSVGQAAQAFKSAGLRNKGRPSIAGVSPLTTGSTNANTAATGPGSPLSTNGLRSPIGRGIAKSNTPNKTLASIAAQAVANEEKHAVSLLLENHGGQSSRILVNSAGSPSHRYGGTSSSSGGGRIGFSGIAKAVVRTTTDPVSEEKESKESKDYDEEKV